MIRAFSLLIFLFWGTISFAQTDSLQKERSAYRQAEALFQSGQIKEATEAFKKLTQSVNTAEAAHFRLSTIYLNAANYPQAIYHVDQSLTFCKNCDDYLLQKAQILYSQGKYNEAGEIYLEAININPQFWTRYNKAIYAFKSANNTKKAIEVTRLWEKQFQLKPEIGIRYIQEFTQLNLPDSAMFYAKKLLLKYPKNTEVFKKTEELYKANSKYSEFSEILKLRYLLDTNNLDFQLDLIPSELMIQKEKICEKYKNEMSSRKECMYFSQRIYYQNNSNMVRKICFNKNLSFQQKNWAYEIFFGAESNMRLLDSCFNQSFYGQHKEKIEGFVATSNLIAMNLYSLGKFKEAQPYFLNCYFNHTRLNRELVFYTLHCCAMNNDKEALNKCKIHLEEIFPFAANAAFFDMLIALADKKYSEVLKIINSISNIDQDYNRICIYNVMAISLFQNGEINKAVEIWNKIQISEIFEPLLIPAYQSFKQVSNYQKATQILNMAYFLGTIDEERKLYEMKSGLKTK